MSENKFLVPFVIFLVLTVILGSIVFFQSLNKITGEVVQDIPDKALMFGMLDGWAENLYDSSEYLINVDLINFGYKEAKNVEVTCIIEVGDEEGYVVSEFPVTTISKKAGNIASTSYKSVQLVAEKNIKAEGNYPLASCKVTSCENCEILTERIPELQ